MAGDKLRTSEFLIQSLAAIIIGFLAMQTGFVFAWPSYNVANFRSNETVLGIPMSSMQVSLLGSLPNLGGLLAMPLCGWLFNSLGRKYGTMLFGVPYVMSWSIIALTNNHTLILIAVTIAGAGIAGQNVAIIYLCEIAHVSIRGAMTASSSTTFLLGILISYALGGYLEYMTVVIIHLTLSVLTILLISLLPDSPVFLVLVGKEEKAAKAIAFYRHLNVKSKEVQDEIVKIKQTINPKLENAELVSEKDQDLETAAKLIEKQDVEDKNENISAWTHLIKSKSSMRILATVLIVTAVTILTGGIILQVYAEPLFAEAVPSMSANQCAIFVALDSMIASAVCVVMIDKFGRKSILMVTSIGAGICTLLMGTQLQFHWAPHWFTAVLIYIYDFMFSTGCAVMPSVLASEVFLPEIRSLCNSFTYSFVWIFNFITVFVFHPLVESVGLGPVFYIFCFMCFGGAVYFHIYLPETKGLSVDAIQVAFSKQGLGKKK